MQFFSTHEIPAAQKLDYWNSLAGDHIFQIEFEAAEK